MSVKTSDLTVCIGLMFKKIRRGKINVSRISSTVEHVKYQSNNLHAAMGNFHAKFSEE
jgi:hypothetical protein